MIFSGSLLFSFCPLIKHWLTRKITNLTRALEPSANHCYCLAFIHSTIARFSFTFSRSFSSRELDIEQWNEFYCDRDEKFLVNVKTLTGCGIGISCSTFFCKNFPLFDRLTYQRFINTHCVSIIDNWRSSIQLWIKITLRLESATTIRSAWRFERNWVCLTQFADSDMNSREKRGERMKSDFRMSTSVRSLRSVSVRAAT